MSTTILSLTAGCDELPQLTAARERFEKARKRHVQYPCETDPHRWDEYDKEAGEPLGVARTRIEGAASECIRCPVFTRCDELRRAVLAQWASHNNSGYPVMIGVMAARLVTKSETGQQIDRYLAGETESEDVA